MFDPQYELSWNGFINSKEVIGVKNTIEESFICKRDISNERGDVKEINDSYYELKLTDRLNDIKFNNKGKSCAFMINNTLYYLDLNRNDTVPQKVLEGFESIKYDIDDDRISASYIDEGQGYLALYKKDTLVFRKRYEGHYNIDTIDSDENNQIICIEGYQSNKQIYIVDEHNVRQLSFDINVKFHYPFIYYQYEKNEIWLQSIEDYHVIHRLVFINTISAFDTVDQVSVRSGKIEILQFLS